jgi:eukaryotic-like serine/threonine-protein kinase
MSDARVSEDAPAEAQLGRIADEFLDRLNRGERPDVEDYARRHAPLAPVLRQVLPALLALRLAPPGPAADELPAPEAEVTGRLGDYRILRELGRGGMGVVYEAEQISLRRRVALKVLPFAAALDPKHLQRFQNEAQAAAHLHHTNIVPVYAVGCERGVHFYVMEFIEGQTLAALIAGLRRPAGGAAREWAAGGPAVDPHPTVPYPPARGRAAETVTPPAAALTTERSPQGQAYYRTVARLGVQAAEALEHAHQMGVVHRDVKPANLLVDRRGNLWVADFGLAQFQADASLTLTGDVVGTLRYMSPEQALGRRGLVDHRTDVYSLGATLYELLTLRPAFAGRDRPDLLRQIAFEEPPAPRWLSPAVPAELETITLKAMAKAPEERYATAQELADDLRRFLEDQPIRAHRPTLLQRARRWGRRHKSAVRAAAVVLLLAAAGLAAGTVAVQREQAQTAAVRAQAATDLAAKETEARERQDTLVYYQSIALAERARSAGNVRLAEQLLRDCDASRRGWEWDYLMGLRHGSPAPLGHAVHLFSAAFSPDGQLLAVGDSDGAVTVWDTRTRTAVRTLRAHAGWARGVAFSCDGRLLASAGWDGRVKVFDAGTGRPLWGGEHGHRLDCVAFSSDGRRLAAGGHDGKVRVWGAGGQELHAWAAHGGQVYTVAFSPDGKSFATGSRDRTVKVWDAATWAERHTLGEHVTQVLGVTFSPDSQLLAAASGDFYLKEHRGELKLWDVRTGELRRTLCGPTSSVFSVAFSPDGKRLAAGGSEDPTVKLWDVATGLEALALRGHTDAIWAVAFSPDGRLLASAGGDHSVRLWDATPLAERPHLELRRTWELAGGGVSAAFHPDGRRVATACQEGTVTVWDRETGQRLYALHAAGASQLAFSPDGQFLAAATTAGTVWVWDADSGRERYRFHGDEVVLSVAFSPDGGRLAAAAGKTVRVWGLSTGAALHALTGHTNFLISVAFSPDGRRLASAGFQGDVRVWDVPAGAEARPAFAALPAPAAAPALANVATALLAPASRTLPGHAGRASCVTFSPDGRRLVSAGVDGVFHVWDTASWEKVASPRCHGGHVHRVVFSPDGKYLASGGSDATLRVWEAATGRPLLAFRGHTDTIYDVAYSRDGKYLASASLDRTVRVWDAQPPPNSPARAALGVGK